MKLVCCRISLEPLNPFSFVTEVEIDSSWMNLSDTAKITFPRNLYLKDKNLREVFKRGQSAKIELGYDGNYVTEFEGYIAKIKPETPFCLELEDEMYQLKQTNFSGAYKKIKLKGLIDDLMVASKKDIEVRVLAEVDLGKLRIEQSTVAAVLAELRDKYGVYSWFQNRVLHVGLPHLTSFTYHPASPIKLNLAIDTIEQGNQLEYVSAEDRVLLVKAVSILPNNKKVEAEVGDKAGEVRTLHYYGIEDKASLAEKAKSDWKKMKVDGYKGSCTAFGTPYLVHGQNAEVMDSLYPERAGVYRVDGTKIVFGQGGYRRQITLGDKQKF